jgi:hypothetical protein
MYVKFVCVKLLYVKFIVVYVRRREEEAGGGEGARDTESKTRTPHKVVGNNSGSRKREMKINERWSRFQMI